MKMLVILLVAFATQNMAFAQTPDKSDIPDKYSNEEIEWAKQRTVMLDDIVNLTEDQRKEIMKINLRYANKVMSMKAKSSSDKQWEDYKEKTFEKRIRKYNTVLTTEQTNILREKRQQLKDKEDV